MCVWTKKRGSMNAVVLMATPCPKSLHGKGEKWIARNMYHYHITSGEPVRISRPRRRGPLIGQRFVVPQNSPTTPNQWPENLRSPDLPTVTSGRLES